MIRIVLSTLVVYSLLASLPVVMAQPSDLHTGDAVPRDVRDLYDRGLK